MAITWLGMTPPNTLVSTHRVPSIVTLDNGTGAAAGDGVTGVTALDSALAVLVGVAAVAVTGNFITTPADGLGVEGADAEVPPVVVMAKV